MLRIATGVIDQFSHFNPGDVGLDDTFTVVRSRNGAAPATMDTPTIIELDSAIMEGEYALLMDEDMDIEVNNLTEQMVFLITHIGMTPQRVVIELFDPGAFGVDIKKVNGVPIIGNGKAIPFNVA